MGVVLLPNPHKNHLGFVLDEKLNCNQYVQSKISKYDQPNGMIYISTIFLFKSTVVGALRSNHFNNF